MRKLMSALLVLGMAAMATVAGASQSYTVDNSHSYLGFAVKHMVVASTKGEFKTYEGSFTVDPADLTTLKAKAKIDAKSIDTSNADRDAHLRKPDFFDAEQYPDITFETTKVEKSGEGYVMTGNLTMKGVTKEIALPIEINGPITDPWGNTRLGFEGSTVINRQDWGINFSKALDNGGLVVANDVKINISVEGILNK